MFTPTSFCAPESSRAWVRALARRDLFEVEHRVRLADGRYRWSLTRGVPVFDGPTLIEWVGSVQDVSSRHAAEEALRRQAERFALTSRLGELALSGVNLNELLDTAVRELAAERLGAEAWGPMRAIAAQLGLPPGGPLLMPASTLLA